MHSTHAELVTETVLCGRAFVAHYGSAVAVIVNVLYCDLICLAIAISLFLCFMDIDPL